MASCLDFRKAGLALLPREALTSASTPGAGFSEERTAHPNILIKFLILHLACDYLA
jgi:hypothetical protein